MTRQEVPTFWHGRHIQQNMELIETAGVIYKMSLMTMKEIKSFMLVFELVAR